MNEEVKENGVTTEQTDIKEFKSSWPKAFSWVAFVLSVVIPVASIGLSIMCLSGVGDDERDEVSLICYIAIGVSACFLLNDLILNIVFM